jgi:hypothetical protein
MASVPRTPQARSLGGPRMWRTRFYVKPVLLTSTVTWWGSLLAG